jgi:Putative DNA-binding domain
MQVDRRSHSPDAQVDHFYEDCEAHREVEIALRYTTKGIDRGLANYPQCELPREEVRAMTRTFRTLVGTAALIFALLFTTAALAQYWFLRRGLNAEEDSYLRSSAEEMRERIGYVDTWNLQGYRRTTEGPGVYIAVAQNGTLIDTFGCPRSMLFRVSLPFVFEYGRPFRFSSDVGEDWDLYVRKLPDGLIVLGVRTEMAPKGVDALFESTAARFGASVAEASRTPEHAIHEAFDFAVIDAEGDLLRAIGGIPMKASPPAIPQKSVLVPVRRIDDKIYAAFLEPITSKSGSAAGLISVFADVTENQRLLRQSTIFNGAVSAFLWIMTLALSVGYLNQLRPRSSIQCAQIPLLDEGDTVEFKSALRWDYIKQQPSKEVERAIAKTVVGFLNSTQGGTLVIGLSDTKEILGLDADYSTFTRVKADRDGFEQMLHQILINAVGESRCVKGIKTRFCSLQGKELCVIYVSPSSEPVFLKGEGSAQLYVRVGNSTRAFGVQEALDFARDRWGGLVLRKPRAGHAVAT